MSVIWIIEKSDQGTVSLATKLMGSFAVRAFASFDSLAVVYRCMPGVIPAVVVVVDPVSGVVARLQRLLPKSTQFVLIGAVSAEDESVALISDRNFESLELISVINRLVERGKFATESLLTFRSLTLDTRGRRLAVDGEEETVELPGKEADILAVLMGRRGQIVPRSTIADIVWPETKVTSRTLDSHVSRLRQKLCGTDVTLEAVYGSGYILR